MATTTNILWWDQRGQIGCESHMPYVGSDTFVWDDWRPITAEEAAAFEADVGRLPECETCAAIARRSA
jgi:hypothetical protein